MEPLEMSLMDKEQPKKCVRNNDTVIILLLVFVLLIQIFLVVGVCMALNDFMKLLPEAKKSLTDIQSAYNILYHLCETTFKEYC